MPLLAKPVAVQDCEPPGDVSMEGARGSAVVEAMDNAHGSAAGGRMRVLIDRWWWGRSRCSLAGIGARVLSKSSKLLDTRVSSSYWLAIQWWLASSKLRWKLRIILSNSSSKKYLHPSAQASFEIAPRTHCEWKTVRNVLPRTSVARKVSK